MKVSAIGQDSGMSQYVKTPQCIVQDDTAIMLTAREALALRGRFSIQTLCPKIWLVAHCDLRTKLRKRLAFDLLSDDLSQRGRGRFLTSERT